MSIGNNIIKSKIPDFMKSYKNLMEYIEATGEFMDETKAFIDHFKYHADSKRGSDFNIANTLRSEGVELPANSENIPRIILRDLVHNFIRKGTIDSIIWIFGVLGIPCRLYQAWIPNPEKIQIGYYKDFATGDLERYLVNDESFKSFIYGDSYIDANGNTYFRGYFYDDLKFMSNEYTGIPIFGETYDEIQAEDNRVSSSPYLLLRISPPSVPSPLTDFLIEEFTLEKHRPVNSRLIIEVERQIELEIDNVVFPFQFLSMGMNKSRTILLGRDFGVVSRLEYKAQSLTQHQASIDFGLQPVWGVGAGSGTTWLIAAGSTAQVSFSMSDDDGLTWFTPCPEVNALVNGHFGAASKIIFKFGKWYVMTGKCILISNDATASSWNIKSLHTIFTGANAISDFDISDSGRIFFCGAGNTGSFFYTDDEFETTNSISSILVDGIFTQPVRRVTTGENGSVVYTTLATYTNASFLVARSGDDGATWSLTSLAHPNDFTGSHQIRDIKYAGEGIWYASRSKTSTIGESNIQNEVLRSIDDGATWNLGYALPMLNVGGSAISAPAFGASYKDGYTAYSSFIFGVGSRILKLQDYE